MPPERRCEATTANGEPCSAPSNLVDTESGLCPSHDPAIRDRIREGARKGGQASARKRRAGGLDEGELPELEHPKDAERLLEIVARAVATGRLAHNEGKAIARLVREWLRARDAGEVEDRVEALEEKIAAAKRGDLEVVE